MLWSQWIRSANSWPWIPCWVQPLTIWPRPLLNGEPPVVGEPRLFSWLRLAPEARGALGIAGGSSPRAALQMPRATATARMQNLFIISLLFRGKRNRPSPPRRRDIQGANLALGGWVNPKLGQKMRGVKKDVVSCACTFLLR